MKSSDLLIKKIKTIELLLNEIKEDLSEHLEINPSDSNNDIRFTLDLTPTRSDLKSRVRAHLIEKKLNPHETIINKTKTFENIIIGPSNNLAVTASKTIALKPGKGGENPSLFIHSSSGLGKTHLLHAIANEIKITNPDLKVCLITARSFMDEMIMLMKKNRIDEFLKNYTKNVDVLIIDDIHELKNKEGTQEQFFHLFNEMHSMGKQLVFASDKRPSAIEGISERIKSRLQWGLVVDIQSPDLEMRVAILRNFTQSLAFPLKDEIIFLIAESTEHNPRNLESAILRIKAASELMNVEVSCEFVKEQLLLI